MLPFLWPAECLGGWPSSCIPTILAAIDEGKKKEVEFFKQVLVKEILKIKVLPITKWIQHFQLKDHNYSGQ